MNWYDLEELKKDAERIKYIAMQLPATSDHEIVAARSHLLSAAALMMSFYAATDPENE